MSNAMPTPPRRAPGRQRNSPGQGPFARRPAVHVVGYHLSLVEQGDWDNDADYPRAPLPAHERAWRHPSEMGSQEWTRSEPPLVVGRGLTIATGTVGAVLALGLLWLMIPHSAGRGGLAVDDSTTSVRAVALSAAPVTTRELIDTSVGSPNTIAATTVTSAAVVSSEGPTPSATDAASPGPAPTMVLGASRALSEAPPIAVALMPGHYVVTTAAAVRGREGFAVLLPSGETVLGAVVAVDVDNGTAVLSVTTDIDEALIRASGSDISSGEFMVMTPDATSASVWVDDSGTQVAYEGSGAGEGSVVLDRDGGLVGLCTHSATGVHLVTVATLMQALAAAADSDASPAWLGIEADMVGGVVTVIDVLDGGPAQAAGVAAGDVITAVDGVPIADLESLRTAVTSHAAGQTVTLTVGKTSLGATNTTTSTASVGVTTTATAAATTTTTTPAGSTSTSTPGTAAMASTSAPAPSTTAGPTTTIAVSTSSTIAMTTSVDIDVTLAQPPSSL